MPGLRPADSRRSATPGRLARVRGRERAQALAHRVLVSSRASVCAIGARAFGTLALSRPVGRARTHAPHSAGRRRADRAVARSSAARRAALR